MSRADQQRTQPIPPKLPIVAGLSAGPVEDFEALLGEGTDLWADDDEFQAFLTEWRRWRKQDRDTSRQP
jgi:hypothetical protein